MITKDMHETIAYQRRVKVWDALNGCYACIDVDLYVDVAQLAVKLGAKALANARRQRATISEGAVLCEFVQRVELPE